MLLFFLHSSLVSTILPDPDFHWEPCGPRKTDSSFPTQGLSYVTLVEPISVFHPPGMMIGSWTGMWHKQVQSQWLLGVGREEKSFLLPRWCYLSGIAAAVLRTCRKPDLGWSWHGQGLGWGNINQTELEPWLNCAWSPPEFWIFFSYMGQSISFIVKASLRWLFFLLLFIAQGSAN